MKLAIVGPATAGKDSAALWLAGRTPLRFGRSTSDLIIPEAARRLGLPEAEVRARKAELRAYLAAVGDDLRRDDPAALARATLDGADLCVGVRRRAELHAARDAGLFDLVLWVERPGLPPDPTLEFGPEEADLIVRNDGPTLDALHARLDRLARSWGLLDGGAG